MHQQHRLRTIQVANWGTLDGYHRIEVPSKGLLVTGESGSGKSSLLDAMATLLVPPASLRFNAAAQQGDRGDQSRNAASYVRGAYRRETDEATDQIVTGYLRPQVATWSGVALTYAHADGRITSLVHLLHIPAGTNSPSDVSHLYVVAHEEVDLRSLAPAIANGVNVRALHAEHPDWFADRNHPKFSARMQRRLGFRDEQALQLLHKTQSAKNLNNLNQLLRDFMLDRPDTFALAEEAVNQFVELSSAHAQVVDTRRQVECLQPLAEHAEVAREAQERTARLEEQSRHLGQYVLRTRHRLGSRALDEATERLDALEVEMGRVEDEQQKAREARDQAQRRVDGISSDLGSLEQIVALREQGLQQAQAARARLAAQCARAGLEMPDDAAAFELWQASLDGDELANQLAASEVQARASVSRRSEAERERDRLQAELDSLSTGSAMSPHLLAVRELLCRETGVDAARLPFAGELLDVDTAHADWQGAIERVLRPLAQTLLVPEELHREVSAVVDRTHLGGRLVYARTTEVAESGMQDCAPDSLVRRVLVADGEHHDWLAAHLAERFDYACVEDSAALSRVARGVTRQGQVKHTASRHEKDDRRSISDRTQWLLGSSVETKRAAVEEALAAAQEAVDAAIESSDRDWTAHRQLAERIQLLGELQQASWAELDVVTATTALDEARRELQLQLETTEGLVDAQQELQLCTERREQAELRARQVAAEHAQVHGRVRQLELSVAGWERELSESAELPDEVLEELAESRPLGEDLTQVDARAMETTQQLAAEQLLTGQQLAEAAGAMTQAINNYRREWPAESANLASGIAAADDYLAILQRLLDDGLPDFEGRFFGMLATQSRNNVGELASRVRASRELIRTRVKPINRSLRETEYAPGKHLQVKVRDRHLPEVRAFLDTLSQITAGSLDDVMDADDSPESRQRAEQRFLTMKELLDRLASQEPADVEWRNQVLDTRRHVDFRAVVVDETDTQVDAFEGSGGLSGGERQKLVTFCLAAALRYQLAHDGTGLPEYALVVLDEAFDKTDPRFTRACLQVFADFGFQLLLATPQKMLQALEDHVGGVALVVRPDEGPSWFQQVLFDEEQEPLVVPTAVQRELI